jgi:hypothetical protein
MRQAAAAAAYLLEGPRMNGDAERALETGLVVCYARPYVRARRGAGAIGSRRALPSEPRLRALHDALIDRRNDLYAHNDVTDLRGVEDVYAALGLGGGRYAEAWRPIDRAQLPEVVALCESQRSTFRALAERIEARLADEAGD